MRTKKLEPHADEGQAQQSVPQQQGQDLLVPEEDEEMEGEEDYEGILGMAESTEDEATEHEPAAHTQGQSITPQSRSPPVSKDEPERKRQRIQWFEEVIDRMLGGFGETDRSLCDRDKFKMILSDLDEQWTSILTKQTRRSARMTRPARMHVGKTQMVPAPPRGEGASYQMLWTLMWM